MATKKSTRKAAVIALEGHPYPHGGLDYGKNHPSVPKEYGQQFRVDNTYYRLSGKPTLGLPLGSAENTGPVKVPKASKASKATKSTKTKKRSK